MLAAGQGKRMQSKVQKQFLELEGHPLLYYSLKVFQESSVIDEIILVTSEDCLEYCETEIKEKYQFSKIHAVIPGGKERYDSVYEGLKACPNCDFVFIHDGARPFITEEILNHAYTCVLENQACVVGMPAKDTIKIADEDEMIAHTPNRNHVWVIQTPQVFSYSLVKRAYDKMYTCGLENVTDDAMVVEAMEQQKIKLVQGSYENIKITTPEDLKIAKVFCQNC